MIITSVRNKSNITEIPEVTSLRRQQWKPTGNGTDRKYETEAKYFRERLRKGKTFYK
jgi:hypothetical protein